MILTWVKSLGLVKWVIAGLAVVAIFLYVDWSATNRAELEQLKQEQAQAQATREKARKANENIKSSPDFISDWLQSTGRFRD